jgi:hypothetical protein
VINFEQPSPGKLRHISLRAESWEGILAANDKHKDYVRYAEHCLKMVPAAADQEYRAVQREMAAEWLKLADAVLHPLKRTT